MVYGFGPDELARIRQATPDAPLYSALRAAAESDAHAAEFLRDLDRWRRRAAAGSVRTLVERIWDEKQIGAVYAAMKDGALRLANLRLLMEYAVTYEQAGYRGLSGFIRYIDRLQAMIFPTGGADLLYAYIALIVLRNSIRPLLPFGAEDYAQLLASRFQAQIEGED